VEAIKNIITQDLGLTKDQFTALDSGCGEGFYTQQALRQTNSKRTILGTDISKYAVKIAAKKYPKNFFFVSSAYQLPIASESIDLVLSVFSPNDPQEFSRVLKPDGYILVVSPAENHMKQLAELIYSEFRPHEHNIEASLEQHFALHFAKKVCFEIVIKDAETLQALHKMTPYFYNTSKEAHEKIAASQDIAITCDFHLSVFKKRATI
jgi:23S rRNA (guanine745-N1)-methyltransferase